MVFVRFLGVKNKFRETAPMPHGFMPDALKTY